MFGPSSLPPFPLTFDDSFNFSNARPTSPSTVDTSSPENLASDIVDEAPSAVISLFPLSSYAPRPVDVAFS
ncbi:hypothetical protein P9112_005845 [Eukaryota sp. TZLM1-RC]